jgi:oxygen-independent coproporphyrinogen-3 oxidase
LLPIPDPDLAAEQYEWTMDFLASEGYVQYEISNWALDEKSSRANRLPSPSVHGLPSYACEHNLQYWRNLDYLGLGAGAHGYAGGFRYSNVLRIKTYIDRLTSPLSSFVFPLSPATVNQHQNTPRDDMQETMITGLRLTTEGISAEGFRRRFGLSLPDVFGKEIQQLERVGLLEWAGDTLRLTKRGRLLGNQVFMEFVG